MAGVIGIVSKNPAATSSPLDGPIVVIGNRCEHAGGVSTILATSDLDIDGLDPARKAAAASAFARLCHTLETPMQLLVQVRPFVPDGGIAMDPHRELDEAMHRYWRDRYVSGAKHSHRVYVALRANAPDILDSACAHAADRLSAVGITTHRREGKPLSKVVLHDYVADREWTPWYEHARYLSFNDLFTRGYALRRLPGHPVDAGWLAPLLSVQAECDIAIHLAPAPLSDALGRLNRRMRDFSAHRMLEMEGGALADVHVDIGLDSTAALRERLARNLGRPLHLSVVATARALSLDELDARGTRFDLASLPRSSVQK
jgi:hypothetical protein